MFNSALWLDVANRHPFLGKVRRFGRGVACAVALAATSQVASADVFYVGVGAGCNAASLGAAVLGSVLSDGDDEIRLTVDQAGVQQELLNFDPSTIGSVTIIGGYESCGAPTSSGNSNLSGTATGPVIEVNSTGGNRSVVVLENLDISGASGDRGVEVDGANADVEIRSSVIWNNRGGVSATNGASLDIDAATLIHVNDALSAQGGGILCDGSNVTTGASVRDNMAATGGGIYLTNGCFLQQTDGSWVRSNRATWGGGIAASGTGTRLSRLVAAQGLGVLISDNTADDEGGGLWIVNSAQADLFEINVTGNRAGIAGAGIFAANDSRVQMSRLLSGCTFAPECSVLRFNRLMQAGSLRGSAVLVEAGSEVHLSQTFIERNTAESPTAFALYATDPGTVLTLEGVQMWNNETRSLFEAQNEAQLVAAFVSAAGNEWESGGGTVDSEGGFAGLGSSIHVYSSVLTDHTDFGGSGSIDLDCSIVSTLAGASGVVLVSAGANPLFRDASGGDLRLGFGSPAIDYCDNSRYDPVHLDLDHAPRGVDDPNHPNGVGVFDIGAYEFDGAAPLFTDGFESGNTSAWSATSP